MPTGSDSARIDRRAIDEIGVPGAVLMENAGRSAAILAHQLFPEGDVVGIVGGGNNGGDALVALRTLAAWGRSVRGVLVSDREPDDLLHGFHVSLVPDGELSEEAWQLLLGSASVVLDGILGTGIRGEPRPRQAAAIRRINEADRPVVALDVPSGADADSGATPGDVVDADVTICFGFPKLGVLLHPARARAGRVVAVEIGFPPAGSEAEPRAVLATPGWAAARLPVREPDTHKNAVGALIVVAGRQGMAGAAVLATRAAMRGGAGMVRVASPGANRTVLQAAAPEAVYVDSDDRTALREALQASRAVVVGPGLGTDDAARTLLAAVLEGAGDRPLLVDADGLNLLARGEPSLAEAVGDRPAILTPHVGEMSRLIAEDAADVAADRPGIARRFAEAHGCAVLLKGTPSLVAAPGHPLLLDSVGSSDLASAGMGDVLSGVVGAFLAQGLSPWDAGGLGLVTSGRAAALAGRGAGLLPTDVIQRLPEALVEEGDGETDLRLPGLLLDMAPST